MYSGIGTAEWTEEVKIVVGDEVWVCGVMFSSDKTNITLCGGRMVYPVYIQLTSMHVERRRKADATLLLSYLPVLDIIKAQSSTDAAAKLRRQLYHRCMQLIFEPLLAVTSTYVTVTSPCRPCDATVTLVSAGRCA